MNDHAKRRLAKILLARSKKAEENKTSITFPLPLWLAQDSACKCEQLNGIWEYLNLPRKQRRERLQHPATGKEHPRITPPKWFWVKMTDAGLIHKGCGRPVLSLQDLDLEPEEFAEVIAARISNALLREDQRALAAKEKP